MSIYISEEQYAAIVADQRTVKVIWIEVVDALQENRGLSTPLSFNEKKEAFLWFIERALREGKMKLAKKSVFLEGSPEEQVQKFREALPKDEQEALEQTFLPETPANQKSIEGAMSIWFWTDESPADGACWFDEEYGWVWG